MDRRVTATYANQHFSRLLREVREGETVIITSRDQPVATLAPAKPTDQAVAMKAFYELVDSLGPLHAGPWKREDLYD